MSQRQVVVSAPTSDFINWRNAALLAVSKASVGFWGGVFPAIALELPCTMSRWFESLMDLMDLNSGPAMYNASNALLRFGIFCWSSESPTF